MLARGSCRNCRRDYRSVKDHELKIYRRNDGKWCSRCSCCNAEQPYTRKDHAKQSELSDWQCKQCVAMAKGFSSNRPVGDKGRLFNKYMKSARKRGISWNLSFDQMFASYTGYCALTGWEISIDWTCQTASLDRIDSSKGYTQDNVQWVHSMVNMCKNKYDQDDFLRMCMAITVNVSKIAEAIE